MEQWDLRTGGAIKKIIATPAGNRLQWRAELHLTKSMNKRKTIWLGEAFELGNPGTTLDASLGLDATLPASRTALYAEITRQHRISRAGHQGWAANLGAKVRF